MNAILYDKRDFADVIQLRILKLGDYQGLPRWVLDVITRVLLREGGGRSESEEGKVIMETGEQTLRCGAGATEPQNKALPPDYLMLAQRGLF